MPVRIRAYLEGQPDAGVKATGTTLPHAIRRAAAQFADGQPGRGEKRVVLGPHEWTQRWSKLPALLHVKRLHPGPATPHSERPGRRLEVYLSDEASEALDRLMAEHGTARAAVEAALLRSKS